MMRLAVTLLLSASAAQADAQIDRLVGLAHLYGSVRFFHPYLYDREIDWDSATLKAIVRVRAARSDEEYASALKEMLSVLNDPGTVIESTATESAKGESVRPSLEKLSDGTQAIRLGVPAVDFPRWTAFLAAVDQALNEATTVVLDLRVGSELDPIQREIRGLFAPQLLARFVTHDLRGPDERIVVHQGYTSQNPEDRAETYFTTFTTRLGVQFPPAHGARKRALGIVVDTSEDLLPIAVALIAAGDARLFAPSAIGDAAALHRRTVRLPGRLRARVRLGETNLPPLASELIGGKAPDLANVATRLRPGPAHQKMASSAAKIALATGHEFQDRVYADQSAPDVAQRILAAFRFWNAIRFFYPYLGLLDDNWDDLLPRFIAEMQDAEGTRAYAQALARMTMRVSDGHVGVYGNPTIVNLIRGEAGAPVRVREIEGQVVVSDLLEGEPGAVHLGDVVVAVDGEPIQARMNRLAPEIPAANAVTHRYYAANFALRGPKSSTVTLTLRDRSDAVREVKLSRVMVPNLKESNAPHFRVLEGNVGYVDLGRLEASEVDNMFEALGKTRAIVFDDRSYPLGTAWPIAARLGEKKHHRTGPRYEIPQVDGIDDNDARNQRSAGIEPLPDWKGPRYLGRTLLLIDERTQSQGEFTGLMLEVANGTRFVGSQTAGSDGDITYASMPGGVFIRFSGLAALHADGRVAQRIGLVPDVEVRPTFAGLRSGKDEVLARALELLR